MATEEPVFTSALKEGDFELRDYPALVVAEALVQGNRSAAASEGFRLLAGYIFGGNTRRQSIAMTAPVAQTAAGGESIAMTAPVVQMGGAGGWTVRFVMPSAYGLTSLPVPNDPRVQLRAVPPQRFAVVRFSGLAHDTDIAQRTTELHAFANARHLRISGPVALARYNPPWTPWFMRRNEVMLPVHRDPQPALAPIH